MKKNNRETIEKQSRVKEREVGFPRGKTECDQRKKKEKKETENRIDEEIIIIGGKPCLLFSSSSSTFAHVVE